MKMGILSPETMRQRFGYFNKNNAVVEWCGPLGLNPSIAKNPGHSQLIVNHYKHKLAVDCLYGGWLEDRSAIWAETYLKETKKFLHLGDDIWVKAGTDIFAPVSGPVIYTGFDNSDGGWGGHVVQLIEYTGEIHALIYAHLTEQPFVPTTSCGNVRKGSKVGVVGGVHENGGWAPHLHIQLVRDVGDLKSSNCEKFMSEMDGYGKVEDIRWWAHKCPDPTPLIF